MMSVNIAGFILLASRDFSLQFPVGHVGHLRFEHRTEASHSFRKKSRMAEILIQFPIEQRNRRIYLRGLSEQLLGDFHILDLGSDNAHKMQCIQVVRLQGEDFPVNGKRTMKIPGALLVQFKRLA